MEVILPSHPMEVQKIRQRSMVEARIHFHRLAPTRINHYNEFRRGGGTAGLFRAFVTPAGFSAANKSLSALGAEVPEIMN